MTFANPHVLEFYKELPFNYLESVGNQARTVKERDSVSAYPVLADLLNSNTRVLEVGCGAGWLANSIACHYSAPIHAIDFNPVAIERAAAVAKKLGLDVRYEVADLFNYEPDRRADIVVSLGVLHHTDNCHAAIRKVLNDFVQPGGYAFIGLYHSYGRRPFLEYFDNLASQGASEEEMFERYRSLMPQAVDSTHAMSWFRDQVLHPHETQHTLAEMLPILNEAKFDLLSTSINRFEPIDDIDDLLSQEENYEQVSRSSLKEGRYFPGFFVFLAKSRSKVI